jgi:hypothetical protein
MYVCSIGLKGGYNQLMLIVVHYVFNLFICLKWLEGQGVYTDKNICLVLIVNSRKMCLQIVMILFKRCTYYIFHYILKFLT